MEESRKPKVALSDSERFPLLSDLSFLHQLLQDEFAPVFNFKSGDRLDANHLIELQHYREQIKTRQVLSSGQKPGWVDPFVALCIKDVPHYQGRANSFEEQPTLRKDSIRNQPWNFVSNTADLNELLVYQTSGTTGPPMDVLFSPVSQACWLPQLESVLRKKNIELSYDSRQVAIALICNQLSTITYASLSTYLKGAGVLKVNLNPAEWKSPDDCIRYIEKHNPEILTGDPFAFLSLRAMKPKLRPKALISSATHLNATVDAQLTEYFQCPVIDIYSMTECRMLAYRDGDIYRSIRPDLYFEVFNPNRDELLNNGEYGELVITGGNNPFLPLIRYRTGDYCRLKLIDGVQCLYELEGRTPVQFFDEKQRVINSIDVSRTLAAFSLAWHHVHQHIDGSITFDGWSDSVSDREIIAALQGLFGKRTNITINMFSISEVTQVRKAVNYSSDLSAQVSVATLAEID